MLVKSQLFDAECRQLQIAAVAPGVSSNVSAQQLHNWQQALQSSGLPAMTSEQLHVLRQQIVRPPGLQDQKLAFNSY